MGNLHIPAGRGPRDCGSGGLRGPIFSFVEQGDGRAGILCLPGEWSENRPPLIFFGPRARRIRRAALQSASRSWRPPSRFRISWFSIGGHSAAVLLFNDDNFFCILFPPLSFSLVCGWRSANSCFCVGEIPEICLRGRMPGPQSASKVSPSPGLSHLNRRRGQSTATFADMPRNPSPSRLRAHFAR